MPQPQRDPEDVEIKVVAGVEGPSLYVNDFRVAGPKPWGGGKVLYTFTADATELAEAIANVPPGERTKLAAKKKASKKREPK